MSIDGVNQDEFAALLAANLTPSATIKTPERLFGREKSLKQIERGLASPGRQIFIYGDRGVGKTSLALTAANLLNSSEHVPVVVVCDSDSTFGSIVQAIGNAVLDIERRIERPGTAATFGGQMAGFGGTYQPEQRATVQISEPRSINEAMDVVRYVMAKRPGRLIVVIDELERMLNQKERERIAEFIKNIPELGESVSFIFCGIGETVDELIGNHPSAGRIIEPIRLEKLRHNHLWEIIETVAAKVEIDVEHEVLVRISQISDGFPHYVHLTGESMFWSAFDDEEKVDRIRARHFKSGIEGALSRAEPVLRLQYQKATMKTRNTEDYEEALWALADTTSDMRQVSEIYDSSYKRIMLKRAGREPLPREKFNQRLLALKRDGHGRVLVGYGAGWFGYRENILRGFVRLQAEHSGVQLGRDNVIKS